MDWSSRDHCHHGDRGHKQVAIAMIVVNYSGSFIKPSPTEPLDFDSQLARSTAPLCTSLTAKRNAHINMAELLCRGHHHLSHILW